MKRKNVLFSDLHYASELPVNNGSRIDRKLMWFALPMLEKITNINDDGVPDGVYFIIEIEEKKLKVIEKHIRL